MPVTTRDKSPHDRLTVQISDAIVRLLAVHTGHGATGARTTIGEDLVVCVLHGVLSKGEQRLVERGKHDVVEATRSAYQDAMRVEAVEVVEEISGRSVKAFLSANHLDADLAVEVFVLEPAGDAPGEAAPPEPD